MNNTRRQAAFIFAKWLVTRDFPATMLPQSGPDRSFIQDLVYTTIRHFRSLKFVLSQLVRTWPKGEMESLLYIGAAQILYLPSVPDFAAVSETVDAAKECANPSIPKVVNGVLRNLIRRREELENSLAHAPLAIRESFPDALVDRWTERFGFENAKELCAYHNRPADTFLAFPDGSFKQLPRGHRVETEPGFAEGAFIVQDPGTKLAISLLAPAPGEKILDACAAPGGKSVQIAWRGADLVACEVNPRRRRRLEENLKRVRLDDKVQVSASLGDLPPAAFDKVLVDAPCSNTGVFRRRPDARWNWDREKLVVLCRMQREILSEARAKVKPGGLLVYSTCSLEREENEAQVEAFLAANPGATLEGQTTSLPFETQTDGAFAAAIRLP